MMSDTFLSREEVADLTGYQQRQKQRVTHPSQADYPGDTECWGPEYYDENDEPYGTGWGDTAGPAFYGKPRVVETDEDMDEEYRKQYEELLRLEKLFDKEKEKND